MPNGSYADRFMRWERLLQSLTASAQELPQIADELKQLTDLVQHARAMQQQQDASKAQFHDNVAARRAIDQAGEELRSRIMLTLKGKYGLRGDRLYAFGMRPVKARRAKKAAQTPPPLVLPAFPVPTPERSPDLEAARPAAPPVAK